MCFHGGSQGPGITAGKSRSLLLPALGTCVTILCTDIHTHTHTLTRTHSQGLAKATKLFRTVARVTGLGQSDRSGFPSASSVVTVGFVGNCPLKRFKKGIYFECAESLINVSWMLGAAVAASTPRVSKTHDARLICQ